MKRIGIMKKKLHARIGKLELLVDPAAPLVRKN